MSLPDPILALSSRQQAFGNHYHDKTRVNISFHDMPQQPVRPAGVVPDGAKQPAPARPCGTTPIQPTGEARPASASCAGNQAREPRRRKHAPAPARKCAR